MKSINDEIKESKTKSEIIERLQNDNKKLNDQLTDTRDSLNKNTQLLHNCIFENKL